MTNQCKVRNTILGASENDLWVGESENWFSLRAELFFLLLPATYSYTRVSYEVDIVIMNA